MIFHEVKHLRLNISHVVQCKRNIRRRAISASHVTQRVVEPHLIIQVIKAIFIQKVSIGIGIIDLRHEQYIRKVLLDLGNYPTPEGEWHHLCHIASKSVYSLSSPKKENFSHLFPRVGDGVKMSYSPAHVIYSIIQLHRFIPIVSGGPVREAVVSGSLRGKLTINPFLNFLFRKLYFEGLLRQVIKIISRRESHRRIVILSKVPQSFRFSNRLVVSCYMVRHVIYNHLQPGLTRTLNQTFKLFHSIRDNLG